MTITTTATAASAGDDYDPTAAFALEYGEELRQLGRFNLAIFGNTGAGKSTLVNAVFGSDVAATGVGVPVTAETTYYLHPNGLFGMFDTKGIETGQGRQDILAGLREEVLRRRTRPIEEQMHVAWYVLRYTDRRFDDGQAAFVRELRNLGLPVVFVLSQVPELPGGRMPKDAEKLAAVVREQVGDILVGNSPVFVHALANEEFGHEAHGLQALVDATVLAAPHGVQRALVAAQKVDLQRKRDACRLIIAGAGVTAAGIGASPIPFSDAALLVPAQVTMMAAIAAQYALPISASQYGQLAATATVAAGGLSLAGRGLSSLAKLIPGVGTVVGGTINAAIASTLTISVGRAWMAVCEHLNGLTDYQIASLLRTGDELQRIFVQALKAGGKGAWVDGIAA